MLHLFLSVRAAKKKGKKEIHQVGMYMTFFFLTTPLAAI